MYDRNQNWQRKNRILPVAQPMLPEGLQFRGKVPAVKVHAAPPDFHRSPQPVAQIRWPPELPLVDLVRRFRPGSIDLVRFSWLQTSGAAAKILVRQKVSGVSPLPIRVRRRSSLSGSSFRT